jgi:predicted transglutaminase-like cysteine proteinase
VLIARNGPPPPEFEAVAQVAKFMQRVFEYKADPWNADHWMGRDEVEWQIVKTGQLVGDCDDHAFCAVYALADLGIPARVVLCWTETGEYHAVCESKSGWVLDNRRLGVVETWETLRDYRRDRMSGFFEFGEVAQWSYVQRGE